MNALRIVEIAPDADTDVLVGPEGLVWVWPLLESPYVLAARTPDERWAAGRHIALLLQVCLVPQGLPRHQWDLMLDGGGPLANCAWVPWVAAPAPVARDGGPLPTRVVVVDHDDSR